MQNMERLVAINNFKCVQFRPKLSSDQYYITIRNTLGCSSYVGQNTGLNMERTVSLQQNGCLLDGIIMHELIHALGFFHEQSRPDRDNYIKINYQNIQSGMERNFDKYDNSYVNTQNTSYDYGSVMHYDRYAFSSNGLPTIETLQNGSIGQRTTMSSIDIQEVRLFYNCSSTGTTFPPVTMNRTGNLYAINTTVSSSLTSTSSIFIRYRASSGYYYYEAFRLTVPSYGYYRISSNSSIDTYGYLYQQNFNPNSPSTNLRLDDDNSRGSGQFQLTDYLESNITYIIIVSTYAPLINGSYILSVSGPIGVNIQRMNTSSISTTTTRSTTTVSSIITRYSSALTINSSKFARSGYSSSNFYYESIAVSVSADGYYNLLGNSTDDGYGLLYINNFNSRNATQNLLTEDDDSGGNLQFLIGYYLQTVNKYILVQTTYYQNMTTPFTITASGPATVTFSPTNGQSTTTTRPTTTTSRLTTTSSRLTTTTTRAATTTSRLITTSSRLTTTTTRPATTTSRLTTTTARPTTTASQSTTTTSRAIVTSSRPSTTSART